jgi:hypothetical protein
LRFEIDASFALHAFPEFGRDGFGQWVLTDNSFACFARTDCKVENTFAKSLAMGRV